MDVAVAFPQASSAAKFPPCSSDYYQLDDLLTPEEQSVRKKVREVAEREIAPIMAEYWERAEFPFELVPKLAKLHLAGGTIKVLAVSRIMVAWQPIGIAMGVYDMCHRYLQQRKQFGAPLVSFQINQEKLVRMLGNIQAMSLMGWRLCKIYEAGKMTPGNASLAKAWNTLRARETVSLGRELLKTSYYVVMDSEI